METQPLANIPTPQKRRAYDPASELVSPRHAPNVVGLSGTTIWRLRRLGLFPAPLRLSAGRVAWRRSDLAKWVEERQQAGK